MKTMLKIGIPAEIMSGEGRVALTPDDCGQLVKVCCAVHLQSKAGLACGYADTAYTAVGVTIHNTAEQLYRAAELIVKVKQPLADDLKLLESRHVLFSFLHLAADPVLIGQLSDIGLTAIPFEAVSDETGFPLLAPMSAIAGRLSVLRGASLLFSTAGSGVLLGGVDGSESGRVTVLGAGVAGGHAVAVAQALGAEVHVFDLNTDRLAALQAQWPEIHIHSAAADVIAEYAEQADLVIGAVMLAGRRAPVVLKQSSIARMRPGSVIVDIAIDQGGCVEDIRATSAESPAYSHHGVLYSAVPNMPGAVPRTAAQSLSTVIRPYVQQLASESLDRLPALNSAVAIRAGQVVDPVLQQALAGNAD
jgi:alanine dehydrogenase